MAWVDTAARIRRRAMAPFQQAATYTPAGGSAFAVSVVFHSATERVVVGDAGIPLSVLVPTAEVLRSEFASTPAQGDLIEIDSTTYEVDDFERDAFGVGGNLILRLPQ